MLRLPLAFALVLAVSAYGHNPMTRMGCGCIRNPVAVQLTVEEITELRVYIQQIGVKHYAALSDDGMQALFRNILLSQYDGVVPSSRHGLLQVIKEHLSTLTAEVVPSVAQCGQSAEYLQKSVSLLSGVNVDLRSLVATSSIILHQRGVRVNFDQLNVVLKYGLIRYLKSTLYESSHSALYNLIATLDRLDSDLHIILSYEELIAVRREMEARFKWSNAVFDRRYELAINTFKLNRRRLLATFNTLSYRGPKYELHIQYVIRKLKVIFPDITATNVRILLDVLQVTNTASGFASPKDLLAMISLPSLKKDLRYISVSRAESILGSIDIKFRLRLTVIQIRQMFPLFLGCLRTQGIQPVMREPVYALFAVYIRRFVETYGYFSTEEFVLYVIRLVPAVISRDSPGFVLTIYDISIKVENVLVPKVWTSIYKEGRETIIGEITGPQGNSGLITRRLVTGKGEQGYVENIVNMKPPIGPAATPGYNQFESHQLLISSYYLRQVAAGLARDFAHLKAPTYQIPLFKILARANIISGTGERAAANFLHLFRSLPAYTLPSNLGYYIKQLSVFNLQLTKAQLSAGLQQFFVATRCLGYVIPEKTIPNMFVYVLREYCSSLPSIPAQPFDGNFMEYLRLRLPIIMKQVTVIDNQLPVDFYDTEQIFSVFKFKITVKVKTVLIRYILTSKLLPKYEHGVSVVARYQSVFSVLIRRYSVSTFILNLQQLTSIQAQLYKIKIRVTIQQLRDVNSMVYVGLGLQNRIRTSMTYIEVRTIVYDCIKSFYYINKKSSITGTNFFHYLMQKYKVPAPKLPTFVQPSIQYPKYQRPPMYVLPGISLQITQITKLVVILQKRFSFVTIDNCGPVLAHTILILRKQRKVITQQNCYEYLYRYYSSLSVDITINALDIDTLRSRIGANIYGFHTRTAAIETYLHMYSLGMPIPSKQSRYYFLGDCLRAYRRGLKRGRRVRNGARYYRFLRNYLKQVRFGKYGPCKASKHYRC